jgi:transcriptional regulator with XRE-family HTH domain
MTELNDGTAPAGQRMSDVRSPRSGNRSSVSAAPPQIHLGARLRGAREHAGLTQEDLGRLTSSSRFAIGRIEDSADPRISLRQLQRISEVLGVPAATLLGPSTEGEDPVNRRQLLQATGVTALAAATARPAPGAVGASDVAEISAAVEDLRRLDQLTGGERLTYFADRLVLDAEHLMTGRLATKVGLQLQTVHGKAAVLAGWLSQDSGKYAQAAQHYSAAMTAAQLAGNTSLTVEAAAAMAFLAIKRQQPTKVIQCAQAGQRAALVSRSGPRTRALLAAREAIGYGQQGDVAGVDDAALRTWRALDSSQGTDEPWADFVSEAELNGMIGQAYNQARRYEPSVRHLETALDLFDTSNRPRNAASWKAYLAITHAEAGDPGRAAYVASTVLPTVQSLQSTRLRTDIRTIAGLLRNHSEVPEVQHFTAQTTAAGLA